MWNLSFPELQNKIIQIRKSEPNGSLLFSSTLSHQQRQHPQPEVGDAKTDRLSEFAFASSFGFLFAFYRRLLIMLSFTNFVENASACALSLKSSQSTIQRLVIFNTNFCHFLSLLTPLGRSNSSYLPIQRCGFPHPQWTGETCNNKDYTISGDRMSSLFSISW